MKKRILSLILCLSMLVGMMPTSAFADTYTYSYNLVYQAPDGMPNTNLQQTEYAADFPWTDTLANASNQGEAVYLPNLEDSYGYSESDGTLKSLYDLGYQHYAWHIDYTDENLTDVTVYTFNMYETSYTLLGNATIGAMWRELKYRDVSFIVNGTPSSEYTYGYLPADITSVEIAYVNNDMNNSSYIDVAVPYWRINGVGGQIISGYEAIQQDKMTLSIEEGQTYYIGLYDGHPDQGGVYAGSFELHGGMPEESYFLINDKVAIHNGILDVSINQPSTIKFMHNGEETIENYYWACYYWDDRTSENVFLKLDDHDDTIEFQPEIMNGYYYFYVSGRDFSQEEMTTASDVWHVGIYVLVPEFTISYSTSEGDSGSVEQWGELSLTPGETLTPEAQFVNEADKELYNFKWKLSSDNAYTYSTQFTMENEQDYLCGYIVYMDSYTYQAANIALIPATAQGSLFNLEHTTSIKTLAEENSTSLTDPGMVVHNFEDGNFIIADKLPTMQDLAIGENKYAFTGWSRTDNAAEAEFTSDSVIAQNDLESWTSNEDGSYTLYAVYNAVEEISFTYDYANDIKALAEQNQQELPALGFITHVFEDGDLELAAKAPSMADLSFDDDVEYSFIGWAKSADATTADFAADAVITESDLELWTAENGYVLYAVYDEKYITITFNLNGAAGALPSVQVLNNSEAAFRTPSLDTLYQNVTVPDGYSFGFWTTEKGLTDGATSPFYFADYEIKVSRLLTDGGDDHTVYVKWLKTPKVNSTQIVGYNASGEAVDGYAFEYVEGITVELTEEVTYYLIQPNVTRDDDTTNCILRWTGTGPNGAVPYGSAGQKLAMTGGYTMRLHDYNTQASTESPLATYTIFVVDSNCVTLNFHANNGTEEVLTQKRQPNAQSYYLPECTFTREGGYTFQYWSVEASDQTYVPGNMICYSSYSEAEDKVIDYYAEYSRTLSFDVNGASGDAPEPMDQSTAAVFALPECEATKDGFVFKGWTETAEPTETDTVYQVGAEYTGLSTTLYAYYEEESLAEPRLLINEIPVTEATVEAGSSVMFSYEDIDSVLIEPKWTVDGTEVQPDDYGAIEQVYSEAGATSTVMLSGMVDGEAWSQTATIIVVEGPADTDSELVGYLVDANGNRLYSKAYSTEDTLSLTFVPTSDARQISEKLSWYYTVDTLTEDYLMKIPETYVNGDDGKQLRDFPFNTGENYTYRIFVYDGTRYLARVDIDHMACPAIFRVTQGEATNEYVDGAEITVEYGVQTTISVSPTDGSEVTDIRIENEESTTVATGTNGSVTYTFTPYGQWWIYANDYQYSLTIHTPEQKYTYAYKPFGDFENPSYKINEGYEDIHAELNTASLQGTAPWLYDLNEVYADVTVNGVPYEFSHWTLTDAEGERLESQDYLLTEDEVVFFANWVQKPFYFTLDGEELTNDETTEVVIGSVGTLGHNVPAEILATSADGLGEGKYAVYASLNAFDGTELEAEELLVETMAYFSNVPAPCMITLEIRDVQGNVLARHSLAYDGGLQVLLNDTAIGGTTAYVDTSAASHTVAVAGPNGASDIYYVQLGDGYAAERTIAPATDMPSGKMEVPVYVNYGSNGYYLYDTITLLSNVYENSNVAQISYNGQEQIVELGDTVYLPYDSTAAGEANSFTLTHIAPASDTLGWEYNGEALADPAEIAFEAGVTEYTVYAVDPSLVSDETKYVQVVLLDTAEASLTVNDEKEVLLTEDEAKQVVFAYSGVTAGMEVALVDGNGQTLHTFTEADNGSVTLSFEHGEHTISLISTFDGAVLDTVQVNTIYFMVNGVAQANGATYVDNAMTANLAVTASIPDDNQDGYQLAGTVTMLNGTAIEPAISGWSATAPNVPSIQVYTLLDKNNTAVATITISMPDTMTVSMIDENSNPVSLKNDAASIDSTLAHTLSIASSNLGVGVENAPGQPYYYLLDGEGSKVSSLTIGAGSIPDGETNEYQILLNRNDGSSEPVVYRTIAVTGYEEQIVFLTVDGVKGDYTCDEAVSDTFTIGYTTEVSDYDASKLVYKYIDLNSTDAAEVEMTEDDLTQYKIPRNWQVNLYETQVTDELKLLDSIIVAVNGTTEYYFIVDGVPQAFGAEYAMQPAPSLENPVTITHNLPTDQGYKLQQDHNYNNLFPTEALEASYNHYPRIPGERLVWNVLDENDTVVAQLITVNPESDLEIYVDGNKVEGTTYRVDIAASHTIQVKSENYPQGYRMKTSTGGASDTITIEAATLTAGQEKDVPIFTTYGAYNVVATLTLIGYESPVYFTLDGVRQADGKVYDVPTAGQAITVGHNLLTADQQSPYTLYKSEYIGETEITAEAPVDWAVTYTPTTTAPITTKYVIKQNTVAEGQSDVIATLTVRVAEDLSVKLMDSTGTTEIADVTNSTGDSAVVVDSTEAYQLTVSSQLFSSEVFSLSDSQTITALDIAAGTITADGTAYKVYVKSVDDEGSETYTLYRTITLKGNEVSASESSTFTLTNNTTDASQSVNLGDTLYITYNPAVTDDEGNVTTEADTFELSVSSGSATLGTSSTDSADATETSVELAPSAENATFTYYAWENGYHVEGDSITLNFVSNADVAGNVKLLVGGVDVTFKRLTAEQAASVVFSYEGLDANIPVILTDNGTDMNAAFENASWTTVLAGGTHEIKLVNAADGAVLDSVSLNVEGAYISLNGQKQANDAIVTVERTNTTQYVDCVATAAGMEGNYEAVYTTYIGMMDDEHKVESRTVELTANLDANSALATAKFNFIPSVHPLIHNYKLYDADGALACELTIETMDGSYAITLNDTAVALDADTAEDQRATLDDTLDYTLTVTSSNVNGSYSWDESTVTTSITIAAADTTPEQDESYTLWYVKDDGTAYKIGTITMDVLEGTTPGDDGYVDGTTPLKLMMDGKEVTGTMLAIEDIGARGSKVFSVEVSAEAGVTLYEDTIRWTYEMYEEGAAGEGNIATGTLGAWVGGEENVVSPTYTVSAVAPGYKKIQVWAEGVYTDAEGNEKTETYTASALLSVDPKLQIILTDLVTGETEDFTINETAEVEVGKSYTLTAASATDEFVWQQQIRTFRMARNVTEANDYESYVDINDVSEGYSAAFKLIDKDTQVSYGDFYVVAKEVTDEGGEGEGSEGGTGGEGGTGSEDDDDTTGEGDTPMEGHWQNEYVWNDDEPELSEGNVTLIAKDTDFATEPAIYYIELNWGDMVFTAKSTTNRTWDWDPEKHISYKVSGSSTTQWLPMNESDTLELAGTAKLANESDFTQDTILIYNHSNKPVKAVLSIEPTGDYGVDFALNQFYGKGTDYTTSGNSYGVTLARGDWNEDDPTQSGDRYTEAAATGAKVTPSGTPDADALPADGVIANVTIKLAPLSSGTTSVEDETTTP